MKKNNKGFTLVELLAVIVVLAVIMVIATQQITKVIKQNTAKSFQSSLDMAVKQAEMYYTANGSYPPSDTEWKTILKYDVNEYKASTSGNTITLTATKTGKFGKVTCADFGATASSGSCNGGTGSLKSGYTLKEASDDNGPSISYTFSE